MSNEQMDTADLSAEELETRMEMEDAAAEPEAAAKPVTMGIGQMAKHLILNSELSNTQILERVQKIFPAAKTTMACIAWYRSDLRKKGLLAKGARQANTVTLTAEQLEELTK